MIDNPVLDLRSPRHLHVVGVGGAGMSAIARVLASMGHDVSGSDLKDSPALERLRSVGVRTHVGHDAANIDHHTEAVTISTAVPEHNAEVVAARAAGLPVLRRAQMLSAIAATRSALAVAGTHGKTTTSSMLALILVEAGLHPSFIIGGDVNEIGTGAAWDTGEWFVIEADESDGTFLELPRAGCIVTNVEPDHLEHYGGWPQLQEAFVRFVTETDGPRVVCADDDGSRTLAASAPVVTYGTAPDADYRMDNLHSGRDGVSFDVVRRGQVLGQLRLGIPGAHNARNAAAAAAMAIEVGASFEACAAAMARFAGVARRFERRGVANGITFVDDYAHLPTEVEAAVAAARDGEWSRVVVVFQPHRYSRTQALWQDFADAFDGADLLVLTDVYASGETPRPGVSGTLLVNAVLDRHPWAQVAYLPHRNDLVSYLRRTLRPGDLCLTLGAGDLTTLPDELQVALVPNTDEAR